MIRLFNSTHSCITWTGEILAYDRVLSLFVDGSLVRDTHEMNH